jgi:arsenate reductase
MLAAMRPRLYGIPNCDTVKRAVAWLREHRVDHDFHDYKKLGAPPELLAGWTKRVDWERLLNRSGTTWRKLGDGDKSGAANERGALLLMSSQPSLIRRPVLDYNAQLVIGFDADAYARLFSQSA